MVELTLEQCLVGDLFTPDEEASLGITPIHKQQASSLIQQVSSSDSGLFALIDLFPSLTDSRAQTRVFNIFEFRISNFSFAMEEETFNQVREFLLGVPVPTDSTVASAYINALVVFFVINYFPLRSVVWQIASELPKALEFLFIRRFFEYASNPTPFLSVRLPAIRAHFREAGLNSVILGRLLAEPENPSAWTALAFFARWTNDLDFAYSDGFGTVIARAFAAEGDDGAALCCGSLVFAEKMAARGRIDWAVSFAVPDKITAALAKWREHTDVWVACARLSAACGYADPSFFNGFIDYAAGIFLQHSNESVVLPVLPLIAAAIATPGVNIPLLFSQVFDRIRVHFSEPPAPFPDFFVAKLVGVLRAAFLIDKPSSEMLLLQLVPVPEFPLVAALLATLHYLRDQHVALDSLSNFVQFLTPFLDPTGLDEFPCIVFYAYSIAASFLEDFKDGIPPELGEFALAVFGGIVGIHDVIPALSQQFAVLARSVLDRAPPPGLRFDLHVFTAFVSKPLPDAWGAAGAFIRRTGLADAGDCMKEFVAQVEEQIAKCRPGDAQRVTVCFLTFLIATRFEVEPLRDHYATTAQRALADFGEPCALAIRALPQMGEAGWALFQAGLGGDFPDRTTLSAICASATVFAAEHTDPAWQIDILDRAVEPFRSSLMCVKGLIETDDIAGDLVKDFTSWAKIAALIAPWEVTARVLDCVIMYLQQCFDAPEIFAPVLALFVTIGDKRPDVIVATPECFLAPFSCLFAPEFDAGSDDWKTVVETTAEFQRRLFTTTGDSWRARFRGVVELFGAGDEHAEGYRLAITADPIDHVAVRAVLNAFRFTRDTAFWA